MLVAAALLRRSDRLRGGQRAARFLLATGERDGVASVSDPETESGSERSVDRSVDAAVAFGLGGGRRFSSSSPSSSRHAFAKPRLQPPSIVRLPEALKRAHDDASSSSSSPSSPSSSFGGARRLGPIAAALSGRALMHRAANAHGDIVKFKPQGGAVLSVRNIQRALGNLQQLLQDPENFKKSGGASAI